MIKEQEELIKEREKQQKLLQEMELQRQKQQNDILFRQQLLLQQHTSNINTELDDLKTYVKAKLNGEPTPPPSPKKMIDPNLFLQPIQTQQPSPSSFSYPSQQQQQQQHEKTPHKSKYTSPTVLSSNSSYSSSSSLTTPYTERNSSFNKPSTEESFNENMNYESKLIGRKKKGIQPLISSAEPIKTYHNPNRLTSSLVYIIIIIYNELD